MSELIMILVGGVKIGSIYALAALGIVVIHKATRVVNFAQGGLVLLGAYGAYVFIVEMRWPYWMAYVVIPAIVGCVAVLIEIVVLRRMRRGDLFPVVIATIFLGIALSEGYRLSTRAEILSVPSFVSTMPFVIGSVVISPEQLWVTFGALLAAAAGIAIFQHGRVGRSMRAMASNVRGAQLCGYSIDRVYGMTWFLGGALAGYAGVFTAPVRGVSSELAIATVAAAFVAAVIGGFDSLIGAVAGGLILGVSETLAAAYISSAMKSAISFLLLFVVLAIRPQGLFAPKKVRSV